eukprot:TRINITY_DN5148_c0_g1_i2.p1 TRINITY_DN5148_c0_g1~~TRINITY_DN5148_c0_g1_i2.p1  ORF type:complete len:215 (-),score=52.09 TRINITY_DN5148_c0_g1_i2:389-1033(-)
MIRRPPRSTLSSSSAASDVYKRQYQRRVRGPLVSAMEGGEERVSQDLASSLRDRVTLTRSQSAGELHKLSRFVGVCSIQGRRQEMEDAHKIVPPPSPSVQPSPSTKLSFFGVFDGHGGRRAADFAEAKLYELLLEHPEINTDMEAALRASFEATERMFLEAAVDEDMMDGTTAAVPHPHSHRYPHPHIPHLAPNPGAGGTDHQRSVGGRERGGQ